MIATNTFDLMEIPCEIYCISDEFERRDSNKYIYSLLSTKNQKKFFEIIDILYFTGHFLA